MEVARTVGIVWVRAEGVAEEERAAESPGGCDLYGLHMRFG